MNGQVLKKLSSFAFLVAAVTWVVGWLHRMSFEEAVLLNSGARANWLQRAALHDKIVMISMALAVILRVTYWVIEYRHDRKKLIVEGKEAR